MPTATATAPRFISPETYQGRYTVRGIPKGMRVSTFTAREIATFGREGIIFESFGHVHGVEHFGRRRYIADRNGNLHFYSANGAKVSSAPADRPLRVLAK